MISGTIPCSVNGISFCSKTIPHIPFCPVRVANLSPIPAIFSLRIRIRHFRVESRFSVTMT